MNNKKQEKNLVVLDRFRYLFNNCGFSQIEIAEKFNCDQSTINKHYNGGRAITLDFLIKYAKLFDCSTDYLLGLADNPTPNQDLNYFCEYTGLDEYTVEELHSAKEIYYKSKEEPLKIINHLIKEFFKCLEKVNANKE
jgi:transcriptional regulator with XRE-family HTH domain